MTIAEQLTRAKADLDAVYAAGKAAAGGGEENLLKYVSPNGVFQGLFRQADFSENGVVKDAVKVEVPDPPANFSELFHRAIGIRKITLIVPTTKAYNGYRLASGYSQYNSASGSILEELVLPDGIKFSNFQEFTVYASKLKAVSFISSNGENVKGIDLSSCTTTDRCFLQCLALEEIRFVPGSITKSISFANSPNLSDESIASIINGLSCDASEQTLTVHPSVAARITETDVTDPGWTLAY